MDFIGHVSSGILLGRLIAPNDTISERKYYLGVCVGASLLPDLDAVSYLVGPDTFAAIHQHYTHTIFALLLFPVLFTSIVHAFHKSHSWIRTYALSIAAMLLHLGGDLIAHWPLQFFYPLSEKGWAFGFIQKDFSIVIDLILAVGAIITFYDKAISYRRLISILTFLVVLFYIFFGPGY